MKVMRREYEDICGVAKLASQDKLGSLRIGMLDNGLTEKSLCGITQESSAGR